MNLELIEKVVGLIREFPVAEIAIEQNGQRISVRGGPQSTASPAPSASLPEPETAAPAISAQAPETGAPSAAALEQATIDLTAQMVGVFHHAKPPVRYGTEIAAGSVVGNIEAMKLMNEVVAEGGGRVAEVLIEDGAPVEYGQPLFRLTPS